METSPKRYEKTYLGNIRQAARARQSIPASCAQRSAKRHQYRLARYSYQLTMIFIAIQPQCRIRKIDSNYNDGVIRSIPWSMGMDILNAISKPF